MNQPTALDRVKAALRTALGPRPRSRSMKNEANGPISEQPRGGEGATGVVVVALIGDDGGPARPEQNPRVVKSDAEWLAQLGEEAFRITRRAGTERPFCGLLLDNKEHGVYFCVCCGLPLFASNAKFQSGTGWPSFFRPFARENVLELEDRSHGMLRTEIECARCSGHLGHVFEDGPPPTGLRYCLNSEALTFVSDAEIARRRLRGAVGEQIIEPKGARVLEVATFGAGCFWGVQSEFDALPGVVRSWVGFMGGKTEDPSYRDVCSDETGHAEVVHLEYDPAQVSYDALLDLFWAAHDPTQIDRQGPDVGSQYRTVIFTHSAEQSRRAEASRDRLAASGAHRRPIATVIEEAGKFYPAEEYHQKYLAKRGMSSCRLR